MQEVHRFEDIDERIEIYLRGKMSPDDAAEFKREMLENKELRARAKVIALMIKSMKAASANQDERIMDEIKGSVKKSRIVSLSYRIAAIAACLCLIFSVTDYQLRKSNTIELATSYSSQFESFGVGIARGNSDTDAAKQMAELEQIKDLDDRIVKLKSMYDKASSAEFNELTEYHAELGLYLAVAHLHNNDRSEAEKILKDLLVQYPDNEMFKKMLEDIDDIKGLF